MHDHIQVKKSISVKRSAVIFVVIAMSVSVSSLIINPLEYDLTKLHLFITFMLSMLVQSFPFLLAGTIVSSLIHHFVSESVLSSTLSHSKMRSIPAALLAAVIFPVCDCASVPIASRLMKKGAPIPAVVTYMLASPILNPVVIASTLFAFPDYRPVFIGRISLGIIIPVILGLFVGRVFTSYSPTLQSAEEQHHHGENCSCGHSHGNEPCDQNFFRKILSVLAHAGEEFVHVSPYIIAGAAISSLVQVTIPKEAIALTGTSSRFFIQPAIMICAAFVLSVCSTSDAFIARGFSSSFSYGSVLGFMTAGPMIDVKNVLMMLPYFRKRFILVLSLSVIVITYIFTVLASILFFGAN